jgi:hypothetical protein
MTLEIYLPSCRMWIPARVAVGTLCLLVGSVRGQTQVSGRDQGFVPYGEPPINYLADRVDDPVAKLQERLDRGAARLDYEPGHGYLKSVLRLLDVPVSSQTLAFSKSSFQHRKISPRTPRALYYNDNVYVGWVRDGHSLELAAFDPDQGAIFYLLEQQQSDQPAFVRATLDCTQCHVAPGTRGVPGVLVRSIYTRPSGTQATFTTSFVTGHESPLKERFGGWYVTGKHGRQSHMGNVFVTDREHPERLEAASGANILELSARFPTSEYLTPHSDLVAQLVLAHQTQMHNLITLTNFQTRLALHAESGRGSKPGLDLDRLSEAARNQIEAPAEELVRYLLFADEAALEEPVSGTSEFGREFAARGSRDPSGRSLREFDLRKRMFKYPCSYLIYSEAFDALPRPARDYVYRRLREVLTGLEPPGFARLSAADRRAILEILLATKPGLPEDWRRLGPAESCTGGPETASAPSSPRP